MLRLSGLLLLLTQTWAGTAARAPTRALARVSRGHTVLSTAAAADDGGRAELRLRARLDDHSVRRRRHNAICALVHEWLRVELRAFALRGNTPIVALTQHLPGVDLSNIHAKMRRPDVFAIVPSREAGGEGLLLIVEVTVCREHALDARAEAKRLKYADLTIALAAALGEQPIRMEEPLVICLGEMGSVQPLLRAELVRRASASACSDPPGAVDSLLDDLVATVKYYSHDSTTTSGRGIAPRVSAGRRQRR
ncbi:hypothetical protein T492DRAFT_1048760 [Pavlovales sp. CCMP2436]|nr:hypothetical protein T492DRAFT_1048760 [Pavlovales sp. CCMP2436]